MSCRFASEVHLVPVRGKRRRNLIRGGQRCVTSMPARGILERYPRLRRAGWLDRMDHKLEVAVVLADEAGTPARPPDQSDSRYAIRSAFSASVRLSANTAL